MKKEKKVYAYLLPDGARGVLESWAETEKIVNGVRGARYRAFKSARDAELWLSNGAAYEPADPPPALLPGVYFDAGTGRGEGVEISVTDEKGKNLLHKAVPKSELNCFGKQLLRDSAATNNYGELLALKYALSIAMGRGGASSRALKIFGDSRLVIDYWSKWSFKRKLLPAATIELAEEVSRMREKFEGMGGSVERVSGAHNPADLGFH